MRLVTLMVVASGCAGHGQVAEPVPLPAYGQPALCCFRGQPACCERALAMLDAQPGFVDWELWDELQERHEDARLQRCWRGSAVDCLRLGGWRGDPELWRRAGELYDLECSIGVPASCERALRAHRQARALLQQRERGHEPQGVTSPGLWIIDELWPWLIPKAKKAAPRGDLR